MKLFQRLFALFVINIVFIFSAGHCLEKGSQFATRLIEGAKQQIGITLTYNPAYQKLTYPMGDLPLKEGVCTDVIIRAFRNLGFDLQQLIHEDMKRHWRVYPNKWKNPKPDKNIDHRRVPNLMVYFQRQSMTVQDHEFQPGDLVVWDLGGGILHIGLLSDKTNGKHPLVIHNICCGVKEEDILMQYKVVGHFRLNFNFLNVNPIG